MLTRCKALIALMMFAGVAHATFTNYTLYGWSTDIWASDQTNSLRQGWTTDWDCWVTTNLIQSSNGTNYHGFSVARMLYNVTYGNDVNIPPNVTNATSLRTPKWDATDRKAMEVGWALYWRTLYSEGDQAKGSCYGASGIDDSGGIDCDDYNPEFFRFERQNIEQAKCVITALCGVYADVTLAFEPIDGPTPTDAGVFSGRISNDVPMWTPEAIAVAAGAPSNYLYYSTTPWRDMEGLTPGYPRVTTNTFTLNTTNAGSVSVTTKDLWGSDVTLTGTNGQVVTLIITNANILSGYTSSDYGWKYMHKVVSLLAWPIRKPLAFGFTTNSLLTTNECAVWIGAATNVTWVGAQGSAETNWSKTAAGRLAINWQHMTWGSVVGPGTTYVAQMWGELRNVIAPSNAIDDCDCDGAFSPGPDTSDFEVYAFGSTPSGGEYDPYGTAMLTNDLFYAVQINVPESPPCPATENWFGQIPFGTDDQTDLRPWADDPITGDSARGFVSVLQYPYAFILLRPDWPWGATIDVP